LAAARLTASRKLSYTPHIVSTPTTPFQENPYQDFAPEPPPALPAAEIDPNNPPWGVGAGVLVWLASIALLLIVQTAAVLPYVFYKYRGANIAEITAVLTTDANVLLVGIISTIPAHLLTLLLVWALVTHFGRRPFRETIGWSWSENVGLWTSVAIAVGLLALGLAFTYLLGGAKTPFDQMLESSPSAKLATAFLATATAPIVEEMVYRGILYPALQRAIGMAAAVVAVGTLFTFVHVAQYYNNLGVIAAVGMLGFALTYIRARTGRLLPCFIIHLVFNGIQCIGLVVEYLQLQNRNNGTTETTLNSLAQTAHALALIF
jgi:hypothetical protein